MATTHPVSIDKMTYDPNSLSVAAGDTVVWTNKMSMAHTATADDGSFDSGPIRSNKTFSYTFDAAGAVPYHCDYHPDMTGNVDVRASG